MSEMNIKLKHTVIFCKEHVNFSLSVRIKYYKIKVDLT